MSFGVLKNKILARLESLGVEARRSLGQNFLINENVVEKVKLKVQSINAKKVIEIGPGPGSLTDAILDVNKNLTVVELDRDWAKYWRDKNITVIEADALKLDWTELLASAKESVCVAGNLPYQISSRLMIELCFVSDLATDMVFMFQKEVADRISAKPNSKEYGLLTVMVQSFYSVQSIVRLSPGDFYPAPKVQSKVLAFKSIKNDVLTTPDAKKKFLVFLKELFKMRRKTVLNNLKGLSPQPRELLQKLGISEKLRPEQLDIATITQMFVEREKQNGN